MKRSKYHYDVSHVDRDDGSTQWDLVPVNSLTYERQPAVCSVIISLDSRDTCSVLWMSSNRTKLLGKDCSEQCALGIATTALNHYRRTGRVV